MELIDAIKRNVTIFDVIGRYSNLHLNNSNKACCPFHNEKTPSFTVYKDTNTYHCFGCGKHGDVINFVSDIKNVSEQTAREIIAQDYNITTNFQRNKDTQMKSKTNLQRITDYIKECHKHAEETNFFASRGINSEMVERFNLGYDRKNNEAIFPYSSRLTYYQARNVGTKAFRKPPVNIAGEEPIYNGEILEQKDIDPIFVVESPLCAISITELGGRAIALGGTNGINKLIQYARKHKLNAPLMLSLDNDEQGKSAQDKLDDELEKLKVISLPFNVAGDCKDPNELLLKDKQKLKKNIGLGISRGNKFTIKGKEFTLAELKDEELPEIYYCVEKMLPQGLTVMAAPPKAGKSFFALQLSIAISLGKQFLNMKTYKSDVLYLALEDNKQRIQHRARKMLINETEWPNNLHINLMANNMDLGLLKDLKLKVRKNPNIRLIIIDTLQKIRGKAGKNETAYTTDYNELGRIKEFADKYDLAILLIHHFRKQKDADDVFNQFSGSNGINGVSDNMLAFQSNKDLPTELKCKGRDVYFDPIAIELNKDTQMWEALGSIEEQKEKQERKEYEENDLVRTCKYLAPKNWAGTATDFLVEAGKVLGHCPYTVSDRSLGRELEKLAFKLKHYDHIIYLRATKTSRTHCIFYENNNTQLTL